MSWYQDVPGLSLQLIHNAKLELDEPIIDIGGGASSLVDYLLNAGHTDLTVLDISAHALEVARERLGGRASEVKWIEEDVTRFEPRRQYSLWHDRAVFHFLTDERDRRRYVATLKQTVKPNGHVVMGTFAMGGPSKCSGLDIVQYDASKLITGLGDCFKLLEERIETHITPAKHEQKFAYFRLLRT